MRSKNNKKKCETKSNSIYKIIFIILSILLLVSISTLGVFLFKYTNLRDTNNNLRNKINNVKEEILNIDNNYITYTEELNNKKIELKDKIEEYNIWLEMIEKVK